MAERRDRLGFALAVTPERAVAAERVLAAERIHSFVVQLLDPGDEETIRLLAERVVPVVRGG